MIEKAHRWSVKLDWLNILGLLDLRSIRQISDEKKSRVIKRVTKIHGTEKLLELEPAELDVLVANELKLIMKKELTINAKRNERLEREMRSKLIPLKKGGIIKIDPRDFKDLDVNADPEDILKYFYKKFSGEDDDDKDDDDNKAKEDKTGYYI